MPNQIDSYPKPLYAWYTTALLLLIYTFSFIDRQILSLLGPAIKADFGISDTQFGLLTGPAFALFYAIFGLFCARLADSKSRKYLIAAGLFLWSLMTAASGFARSFMSLFILRVGVGVGEATLSPAANSILADSFPKKKLGMVMSVYSMGIPIGSALAFYIGGTAIELAADLPDVTVPGFGTVSDWQKTLLVVGLPGIFLTALVLGLKEPSRKGVSSTATIVSVRDTLTFFKSRAKAYWGIYFSVAMTAALSFGTMVFLTFFFHRFHGVTPTDVGKTFGIVTLFTGPAGLLLGGYLADKWYSAGHKDAHIKALLVAPACYLIPAIAAPLVTDTSTAWALFAVGNIFLSLPTGAGFAALQIITPNRMRGQAIAGYILVGSTLGYGAGPVLLGVMTDYVFMDPMKLNYAMVCLATITAPLAFFSLIWGRKAFAAAVVAEETRIATEEKQSQPVEKAVA